MIQLLGAVAGIGLGFLTAFVATAFVAGVRAMTKTRTPRADGLFIGVASGLAGGLLVSDLPHLGAWFVLTSTTVCALAGWRAVILYDRAVARVS
jgi:hypothetical protein